MNGSIFKILPTLIALGLALSGCGGGGGDNQSSDHSNVIQPETEEITGRITFDLVPFNTITSGLNYSQTKVSPARGILVEAMDASANKVGSTTTDSNGYFSLNVDANSNLRLRVSAQLKQTSDPSWDVKVTDNTSNNALYVTEGNLFNSSTGNRVRNIHLQSGWDGTSYTAPRSAGPFAILDAIYESMQKIVNVDSDVSFPPLEVHWSPKNSIAEGNLWDGDIGGSFYLDGKIYVLGKADSDTDEYDRHIIIHEWGHYFEDTLSRTESMGGPHSTDDRLDFRVAFSEGWANALSAMVTDDSFYRDSIGAGQNGYESWSMDMEHNQTYNSGWFNEGSIQSLIYDFYDEDSDGEDNIALGFGPIYTSLVSSNYISNPYFASIYSFTDELKSQQPLLISNEINSLMNQQKIFGSGSDGVGETNNGGIISSLPIYKTVSVGDDSTVCYVNDAGVINKLGNSVFVTFYAASFGYYTFSVTHSDAYGTFSDPDLRLFKSKILIDSDEDGSLNGNASMSTLLSIPGMYILEVTVWEIFPLLGVGNNGTTCFNLQITSSGITP